MPKKEVWGYAKKRETHEALKIAKEKKNGTHESSKVLKRERDSLPRQLSKERKS
jgi:hypothetical protein